MPPTAKLTPTKHNQEVNSMSINEIEDKVRELRQLAEAPPVGEVIAHG